MHIRIEPYTDRVVITLTGQLSPESVPPLEGVLTPAVRDIRQPIVLDLAGVTHVSNEGVEMLVRLVWMPLARVWVGEMSPELQGLLAARGLLLD